MTERYEKRGVSIRLESTSRGQSSIALREGGWALTSDLEHSCGPLEPDRALEPPSTSSAGEVAAAVRRMAKGLAVVERLTLVDGHARHRLVSGTTRRTWEEASGRLFLSLVRQPCGRRASLVLGAPSLVAIDLAPVQSICQALALPESLAPLHAPSVTLEPWVAASLARAVADASVEPGRGLRIVQEPPSGARDGRGRVVRRRVLKESASWTECFRPSYRFAPEPLPLHVDLAGATDDGEGFDFVVVALASGWARRGDTLTARAWIVDREVGRISFARVVIEPRRMHRGSVHMAGAATWFPEGAGAWGRLLTLSREAALVRSA